MVSKPSVINNYLFTDIRAKEKLSIISILLGG